ncbi:hypothetical protein ACJJTC_002936 [Scirpophaga incertulas]
MSNIEIVGLPETPNESPVNQAIKIASHAGVQLQPTQVESAYRVQPMKRVAGLRRTKGISTRDIGLGGTDGKFYVNEHLIPINKQLLNATKANAKAMSYKFVWVRNCNIFLRKNEEAPVIAVNSEKDLQKIN